jgi:hypothetical protein
MNNIKTTKTLIKCPICKTVVIGQHHPNNDILSTTKMVMNEKSSKKIINFEVNGKKYRHFVCTTCEQIQMKEQKNVKN